jgi:D-3-phosphoglycerate dehydrogenase
MRERTKITKSLINKLKKLKFIITSGMRNKAIDLDAAKQKKIIVCGTEINANPAAELTWALILVWLEILKKRLTICTKVIGKLQLVLSSREKF